MIPAPQPRSEQPTPPLVLLPSSTGAAPPSAQPQALRSTSSRCPQSSFRAWMGQAQPCCGAGLRWTLGPISPLWGTLYPLHTVRPTRCPQGSKPRVCGVWFREGTPLAVTPTTFPCDLRTPPTWFQAHHFLSAPQTQTCRAHARPLPMDARPLVSAWPPQILHNHWCFSATSLGPLPKEPRRKGLHASSPLCPQGGRCRAHSRHVISAPGVGCV